MKVICIDDSGMKGWLNEGQEYTADYSDTCNEGGCCVMIIELDKRFFKSRFIPLSTIDETEFERNYKKEPAWIEAFNKL